MSLLLVYLATCCVAFGFFAERRAAWQSVDDWFPLVLTALVWPVVTLIAIGAEIARD